MRSLLASCLFLCALVACASNTGDSMSIDVPADQQQIVVTLPSNPTTGYQWVVLKYDENLFELLASNYIAPQTQLIGAGGNMVFTFGVIKGATRPKSSDMQFMYQRPWEKGKGTIKNVTINFK